MKSILKYTITVLIVSLITSCSPKVATIETTKYIAVHDTTFLHRTDTLVQVPQVSIADFIDITDTLKLVGTHSSATAWVDTTHRVLAGKLIQGGKLPVQIIEKERVVVKDSLITREIPIEVEKPVPYVPLFWKIMSTIGILAIAAVALWLVFKLK